MEPTSLVRSRTRVRSRDRDPAAGRRRARAVPAPAPVTARLRSSSAPSSLGCSGGSPRAPCGQRGESLGSVAVYLEVTLVNGQNYSIPVEEGHSVERELDLFLKRQGRYAAEWVPLQKAGRKLFVRYERIAPSSARSPTERGRTAAALRSPFQRAQARACCGWPFCTGSRRPRWYVKHDGGRSLVEKPLDELRERVWILKAGIRIEARGHEEFPVALDAPVYPPRPHFPALDACLRSPLWPRQSFLPFRRIESGVRVLTGQAAGFGPPSGPRRHSRQARGWPRRGICSPKAPRLARHSASVFLCGFWAGF